MMEEIIEIFDLMIDMVEMLNICFYCNSSDIPCGLVLVLGHV